MKSTLRLLLAAGALFVLGGCAHSIRINPDADKLPSRGRIKRSAGRLAISSAKKSAIGASHPAAVVATWWNMRPYKELEAACTGS